MLPDGREYRLACLSVRAEATGRDEMGRPWRRPCARCRPTANLREMPTDGDMELFREAPVTARDEPLLDGDALGAGFFANRADKVFHVALLLAAQGTLNAAGHFESRLLKGIFHFMDCALAHLIAFNKACIRFVMLAFELRFYEADENAAGIDKRGEGGRERRESDEAEVGDKQVEGSAKRRRRGGADIRSLSHINARVLAKTPIELAIPHVNRAYPRRPRLEKAIGEAAGGRAGVKAVQAAHVLAKRRKRPFQLVSATRDIAHAFLGGDDRAGADEHGGALRAGIIDAHIARDDRALHSGAIGE